MDQQAWKALGRALLKVPQRLPKSSLSQAVARLRKRPNESRWVVHRPAFHKHPLGFNGGLIGNCCDGGEGLRGWSGCVGLQHCGLGFRCTAGCDWDVCLACAAQAESVYAAAVAEFEPYL